MMELEHGGINAHDRTISATRRRDAHRRPRLRPFVPDDLDALHAI
jgi:hypothetical protein